MKFLKKTAVVVICGIILNLFFKFFAGMVSEISGQPYQEVLLGVTLSVLCAHMVITAWDSANV